MATDAFASISLTKVRRSISCICDPTVERAPPNASPGAGDLPSSGTSDEHCMREHFVQDNMVDRPTATAHKGRRGETCAAGSTGSAAVVRREELFTTIRLSRAISSFELGDEGGIVSFNGAIAGSD